MHDVSAQCVIGKCTICPDPNCEHHCHPRGGRSITELLLEEGELELGSSARELDAGETAKGS